ncbi:hypothetical protein GDO86_007565 [Hymenochirus boettgeri]|uniref:Uncharacterized protein n=1 Tax=Hymenochirus boettgeri TaxID=247094 RepID=A0A8T2IU65_9PIPI|nr:hypothetical protein GDO86_007565 [Hymenochirus boettgeri]
MWSPPRGARAYALVTGGGGGESPRRAPPTNTTTRGEIRVFTNSFTITPFNGAEALLDLFKRNPESLDPLSKYYSCTSGLGRNYVNSEKVCGYFLWQVNNVYLCYCKK